MLHDRVDDKIRKYPRENGVPDVCPEELRFAASKTHCFVSPFYLHRTLRLSGRELGERYAEAGGSKFIPTEL